MGFSRRRALMLGAILLAAGALVAVPLVGATHAPAQPVFNIAAAPTKIADTALGAVGYREIGHGPTLLMITGFSAGMDDWAPYFVDALAKRFRVVVFDNARLGGCAGRAADRDRPVVRR